MELLSSAAHVAGSAPPALIGVAADAPRVPDATGVIGRRRVDSLEWTFRNGFGELVEQTDPATWLHPERHGWKRVKSNGLREVWRGSLGGRGYYVKYYRTNGLGSRARRLLRGPACLAEWNSGLFALEAGIAAVEPAGYAVDLRRDGGRQSLLVTEAVEPAQTLSEFWQTLRTDTDAARQREDAAQITNLLAEMIARAHQAGFEHLDMHAANVLVKPISRRRYRTLLVDLHSARLGVPLGDRAVVRNLAQLNQWFRRNATIGQRLAFLRQYLRWRNEYEQAFAHARPLGMDFEQLVGALVREADVHANRLWSQRDRRVCRSGRYFDRIRLPGGWSGWVFTRCKQKQPESRASTLLLESDWWKAQLANPLRWFEQPDQAHCKHSHTATVARASLAHESGPLPVIVKRPLSRNWRRAVAQRMTASRSLRAWRIGHAMIHRDLAVARPLAVLERRAAGLIADSLLITEAIPGAVDLETDLQREYAARTPRQWAECKRALLPLLARHLRLLQERGFAHRDCKTGNILVVRQQLKLLWIDLDGVRPVRRLTRAQALRPLMRLHVSLLEQPGLTRTDRARFLKLFFARFGAPRDAWRRAWREIAVMADRKITLLAARRAWKVAHYGRE